jgi:hypothetical protein
LAKNCQKVVKVVNKLSKSCQKVVKKLSKKCPKVVKKLSKITLVKNLSKMFVKNVSIICSFAQIVRRRRLVAPRPGGDFVAPGKKVTNIVKMLPKISQKVVKKCSKKCQKVVKKVSKSCQKVVKKVVKKMSKSAQKVVKKLSKSCQSSQKIV